MFLTTHFGNLTSPLMHVDNVMFQITRVDNLTFPMTHVDNVTFPVMHADNAMFPLMHVRYAVFLMTHVRTYLTKFTGRFRIPVHLMEIGHNGWQKMSHSADGFFIFTSGPVNGNFNVRLTAINGAQIVDTIPGIRKSLLPSGPCCPILVSVDDGKSQFSEQRMKTSHWHTIGVDPTVEQDKCNLMATCFSLNRSRMTQLEQVEAHVMKPVLGQSWQAPARNEKVNLA